MSFWNSIVSLLTATLSLLGLVHANPTLPQTTQSQVVQVVQQAIATATIAVQSNSDQSASVNPADRYGPDGGGKGGDTCVLYGELKFGDTDVSTGGQVSQLQQFLGINPTTGTYGPETQIAYQNECVGGNAQVTAQTASTAISSSAAAQTPAVATKTYTSGNEFGFQFSYPASFTLTEYPDTYDQNGYATFSVGLSSAADPLLSVSVTEEVSPDTVANCDNDTYSDKISDVVGTPIVRNGITFYAGTTQAQGAGSTDYGSVDAVVHRSSCYRISSEVHASAQDTSSQIASSQQDGQNLIDQIASTFQFTTIEPGAGGE